MTPEQLNSYLVVIKKHNIENIKLRFGDTEIIVTGLLPPELQLSEKEKAGRSVEHVVPDDYSAVDELKDD